MLRMEKYIEKLLLKHDCVIIPGLGGFVSHYEAAYRDDESSLFYPPTRTIGFNEQLKMNDGLLVQAYMQIYDTNFPEADRMVKREVNNIKETLRENGVYYFNNLGTLEQQADNTLLFSPQSEGGIAAPDLYGLDAFIAKPYQEVVEQEINETNHCVAETTPNTNIFEQEINEEDLAEQHHYTFRIPKIVIHYAAAALIAIIFYFAFSVPVSDSCRKDISSLTIAEGALYKFPAQSILKQTFEVSSKATKVQKSDSLEKLTAHPTDTPTIEVKQNVKVPQTNKPQPQVQTTEAEPYYTIVLASSIKHENAEEFVTNLKHNGFPKAQVYTHHKMVRVIYSQFPTEEEARRVMNELRNNEYFAEAWILKIKS